MGSIADDVALLRVDGANPLVPLRLGDAAAVAALVRGTQLASVGFPAADVDATRPRGRLTVDVLGDIRDERYLAVGLEIAPGTSGSPIFRSDGVVVGLVAGGKFVAGPGRQGREHQDQLGHLGGRPARAVDAALGPGSPPRGLCVVGW